MNRKLTPSEAWKDIKEGNARFVSNEVEHPHQDSAMRATLIDGQSPQTILFGCADSRVAAELIFDQGLGDMFVVRTAGHTFDGSVLGSIEYGVAVLGVPLIAILGHDSCGAVGASVKAVEEGAIPPGFVRDVVSRITTSILKGKQEGLTRVDEFEAKHVRETGALLMERSRIIAEAVDSGKLAIVGLTYKLNDGRVNLEGAIGDIGEDCPSLI